MSNSVFPLSVEFWIDESWRHPLSLSHEFDIGEQDAVFPLAAEFGPTYVNRIRIHEISALMVDNKLVTEVTLKHTTEPGTVSGLVYDAEDESFIVDQVFGFGPSGYLVDYRVSGIDPSGQAVSWLYQNQIPEIIWD